jgi:hypothetical protein
MPLWHQGNIKSAGNLPFLIESVTGIVFPSRAWDVLLVAVFVAIFVLVFLVVRANRDATMPGRLRIIAFATAALTLALLLFSKKSWPAYLMLSLFPICLLIDVRGKLRTLGFVFFGLVAVVEHSYWASDPHQLTAQELHHGLLSGQLTYFVFFALQFLLLGGYGWLLAAPLKRLSRSPKATLQADAPEPLLAVGRQ